jgi:hypothetical protein
MDRDMGRSNDVPFEDDEIEDQDPLGERGFAEQGFTDAPGGGPDFAAGGLEEDVGRRPGGHGQKVAGVPENQQREPNTPAEGKPDTDGFVVKERGGESKGDPAAGGTRPD